MKCCLITSLKSSWPVVALLLGGVSISPPAAPAERVVATAPALEVSKPVEEGLEPGESHAFSLDVSAGDYLRIRVEQQGIDLGLILYSPAGESVEQADGPGGRWIEELLSVVAGPSGKYRIELVARLEEKEAGRYRIVVEELRPATPQDAFRVIGEKLYNQGRQLGRLRSKEKRREALTTLDEALLPWRRARDPDGEAAVLDEIGRIHLELSELQPALERFQQSLPLFVASGNTVGRADAYNNIGVALMRLGKRGEALGSYDRALELQAELEDDYRQAVTLTAIGGLYSAMGKWQEALEHLDRALLLRRSVGDLKGEGVTLNNLGVVYRKLGRIDKTVDYYQRALELARRRQAHSDELRALFNLAFAYKSTGELQQTLDHFGQALEISKDLGDRRIEQRALAEIGLTFLSLGEPGKALELLQSALTLSRAREFPEQEVLTLLNLGWVYDALRRSEEARESFQLALAKSSASQMREQVIYSQHGLGRSYRLQGLFDQSLEALGRALELSRELAYPIGEASALRELAEAHRGLGRMNEALDLFHQALDLGRKLGDPLLVAETRAGLARTLRDLGRLSEARAEIEQVLEATSSIRATVASPGLRSSFRSGRFGHWELYIDLLMSLDGRHPGQGLAAEALAASERARARGLVELLAETGIDVREGIEPELEQRELQATRRLSAIQGRLIQELSSSEKNDTRRKLFRAQLEKARAEREQVETQIRRQHARYAEVHYPQPLDLAKIQALLDDRTAFLEVALADERSFLFVVTRDDFRSYTLAPAAEIGEWVEQFRAAASQPGRRLRGQLLQSSERLYELLIEPAAASLAEVDRLLMAPDRELYYLPFEALVTDSGSYLLDRWAVAYVPSATALAGLGRPRVEAPRAQAFVGFAASETVGEAPGPAEVGAETVVTRGLTDRGESWKWNPLPGSGTEVRRIAGLYPPRQATVYLGAEAREENVKGNPLVANARQLHFASHGLLDDREPAYSGLLLTTDPESEEDGLLQVHEIFNLKLAADLVVLSACDTGVGKRIRGEGMIGLSRAFLYAGASSLVVSLWPVADDSTAELMLSFYRHLRSTGKAEALRAAKRDLVAGGKYSHPFYWAPFILVGDPE